MLCSTARKRHHITQSHTTTLAQAFTRSVLLALTIACAAQQHASPPRAPAPTPAPASRVTVCTGRKAVIVHNNSKTDVDILLGETNAHVAEIVAPGRASRAVAIADGPVRVRTPKGTFAATRTQDPALRFENVCLIAR